MTDDDQQTGSDQVRRTLDGITLLSDLPPAVLRELGAKCTWHEFAADELILDRDDDSVDVFFVASGSVRIMNYVDKDRDVAYADLSAGSFFGELSAIDNRGRSARVLSREHSVVASLPRDDFRGILTDHPRTALRLLEHFASIIRAANTRVSSLIQLTPRQRIYAELLRLAEPNSMGDGSWIIEIFPQHNDIASWSGTEREIVANTIGALVRDGIVQRRNQTLMINDHAKLKMLASM